MVLHWVRLGRITSLPIIALLFCRVKPAAVVLQSKLHLPTNPPTRRPLHSHPADHSRLSGFSPQIICFSLIFSFSKTYKRDFRGFFAEFNNSCKRRIMFIWGVASKFFSICWNYAANLERWSPCYFIILPTFNWATTLLLISLVGPSMVNSSYTHLLAGWGRGDLETCCCISQNIHTFCAEEVHQICASQ